MLRKVGSLSLIKPNNMLTRFFDGDAQAWGSVVDRFGKLRRKFSIDMHGGWHAEHFQLNETFRFCDGEVDQRTWRFMFGPDPDRFQGSCADLIGMASGTVSKNEIHMGYLFKLVFSGKQLSVRFDDRMYLIDEKTISNRAVMYKFGIRLGEVNAVFRKCA